MGNLPVDGLELILTFKLATFLDLILTPAVFIAILLMFMRWNRDNESVVYATSGIGPLRYLLPAVLVAAVSSFIVAILSFVVSPYAELGYYHELEKFRLGVQSAPFAKGEFRQSGAGRDVLYYSHIDDNIEDPVRFFFLRDDDQGVTITTAESGSYRFVFEDKIEKLVLGNGNQYRIVSGTQDFLRTQFESYTERISVGIFEQGFESPKTKSTLGLLKSNVTQDFAELNWRISKTIAMGLAVMLAFVWGVSNVRSSTSVNLVAAVVVYFVYSSLLGFTTELMRNNGSFSLWIGLTPHFAIMMLIVFIFAKNHYNFSLANIFRRY